MTQTKITSLFALFRDNVNSVLPPVEAVNERDELYALCDDPMTLPVKLINQHLSFTDAPDVRDCFVENSGFLVVGVVGLQGVGKSSVLNILANRLGSQEEPFLGPFPVESADSLTSNHPQTLGVDMYITQDRIILLDTQPLLSWSLTDIYARSSDENYGVGGSSKLEEVSGGGVGELRSASSKVTTGPSQWSLDFYSECSSLQIISFLFSVCHVVVSVADNFSSPDHLLLRLLDKAAAMKPLIHVDDLLLAPQITGTLPIAPQLANPTTVQMGSSVLAATKVDDGCGVDKAVVCVPHGSDEVGLGQTPSAAMRPQNKQHQTPSCRAQQPTDLHATELAEQAEVRTIVNRLQRLTDYSASLLHVYNLAPPSVFLNPSTQTRLEEYRNLLARSFPKRLRFAALSRLGPQILHRHTALRCRNSTVDHQVPSLVVQQPTPVVPEDRKEEEQDEEEGVSIVQEMEKLGLEQDDEQQETSPLVSNSPPSISETSPKNQLSSDHFPMETLTLKSPSTIDDKESNSASTEAVITNQRESGDSNVGHDTVISRASSVLPSASGAEDSSIRITEKDIVDDCCDLLTQLAEEEQELNETSIDNDNTKMTLFGHPSTIERFFEEELAGGSEGDGDGEHRAIELGRLTRKVAELRRNHFDLAKQIKQPRIFLLPATDEKGCIAFGCPSYQQKAHQLQEAIISTPRQHMMPNFTELHWFEYARNTWASISTSPLLLDYHNLYLANNS